MKIFSSIRVHSRPFAVFSLTISLASSAEPLPLSFSYWKDPAFLKSFNGSYRIEARIEPSLTTEERGLLVEIQDLMAEGKRTAALEKLSSSALTKDSAALTFNLGNLYFEAGETGKAISAFQSALKQYPSFRRAHRNLALAFIRENKLPEALAPLTEAIRLGDSSGTTYGLLGYCRLAREEYASALQAYRLAQVTEPDVAEWSAGIAQCLTHLDAKQEAAALLEEVIRIRPTEASYSVLQSNIYLDLGNREAAVKALELPYRLDLLPPDQILLLANLHLRGKQTDAAREAIEKAFSMEETKPGIAAILNVIGTASALSDWDLARGLFEKTDPDTPDRSYRLASAGFLIGSGKNPESGAEILRKLVSEDPTDGVALVALAKQEALSGQPDLAQLHFERAVKDKDTAYEAYVELSRLHADQSRYTEALTATDAALALRPTEALSSYRLSLLALISASE